MQSGQGAGSREPRALVTGASRGLGAALAKTLAREGWDVLGTCRDPARASAALDRELCDTESGREIRGRIRFAALDLASFDSVRSFAGALLDRGAPLDLLVNNAGISRGLGASGVEGYELAMQTNFLSPFLLTRLLLPLLRGSPKPAVVCVTSGIQAVSGWRMVSACMEREAGGRPRSAGVLGGMWYYASSKFAVTSSCIELASRNASWGLSVSAVHPGVIDTGIMYGDAWYDLPIRIILVPFFTDLATGVGRIALAVRAGTGTDVGGEGAPHPGDRSDASGPADQNRPVRCTSGFTYYSRGRPARIPRALGDPVRRAALWEAASKAVGLEE